MVFEEIGPTLAGDYFALAWWGLLAATLVAAAFIIWRFWAGVQSGRLLEDDIDD
jgi:hypothetical protein